MGLDANILNKQSRTADKGVGRRVNTARNQRVTKFYTEPRTWWAPVNTVSNDPWNSIKGGDFIDYLSSSRRTLLYRVT
jgi:hypothetical protein